jgi:hypothetical protein
MLSGTCQVKIDDGIDRCAVVLDSPRSALYAPPMVWLDVDRFSAGSICLVLTSGVYDEADYVRERAEFERLSANRAASSSS